MHARHRDRVPGRDAYNGAVSSKSRAVHGSPRKEKKRTVSFTDTPLTCGLFPFGLLWAMRLGGLRYDVGLCRFDELYDIHNITSPLMTRPGPNLYMLTKDEQRKARP